MPAWMLLCLVAGALALSLVANQVREAAAWPPGLSGEGPPRT
jgi:hypothetical protein